MSSEFDKKLEEKIKKVKGLFTPDMTVTQVLKKLRGLAGVKPMALNEFYHNYRVSSLNPLESLADGMSFELPRGYIYSEWTYLIQRNDENMGYVIDVLASC